MNCDSVKSGNHYGRFPIHKEFIIFWVWNVSDWLQLINVHRKRRKRIERGRRRKKKGENWLACFYIGKKKSFWIKGNKRILVFQIQNPIIWVFIFLFFFFFIRKINNCFEIISNELNLLVMHCILNFFVDWFDSTIPSFEMMSICFIYLCFKIQETPPTCVRIFFFWCMDHFDDYIFKFI